MLPLHHIWMEATREVLRGHSLIHRPLSLWATKTGCRKAEVKSVASSEFYTCFPRRIMALMQFCFLLFFKPPVVRWLNQDKDEHSHAGTETFANWSKRRTGSWDHQDYRRLPSCHGASFDNFDVSAATPALATNVCRFNFTANHAEPFASEMGRRNVAAGLSETKQRECNVLEHVPSSHTHTVPQTHTNTEKIQTLT